MTGDLLWANHIRGRVFGPIEHVHCLSYRQCHKHGKHPVFKYEIVNTVTSKVIGGDNAYSLSQAMNEAAQEVYIARAAWFYGFKRKDLRRKKKSD